MSCECGGSGGGGMSSFEIYEANWHKKEIRFAGAEVNSYNVGDMRIRAICIGQRSDFDACSVRLGGSPLYPLSVGAPLILSSTNGPIEIDPFPYQLQANSGKPGALSLELYNHVPAWIHDRRRGPSGALWTVNGGGAGYRGSYTHTAVSSTSEATWFYVPTYGRRRVYLWFAGSALNSVDNDDLNVRIDAVSVASAFFDPLLDIVPVDQHYSPVWPDPDDATAFETISGNGTTLAAKAVIDVEGWELLRVRAKKATDAIAESYGFRWLAVD